MLQSGDGDMSPCTTKKLLCVPIAVCIESVCKITVFFRGVGGVSVSRIKLARRIEEERRSRAGNGAVRRDDAHYIIVAEEEVRVLRDYRPRIRIKL